MTFYRQALHISWTDHETNEQMETEAVGHDDKEAKTAILWLCHQCLRPPSLTSWKDELIAGDQEEEKGNTGLMT